MAANRSRGASENASTERKSEQEQANRVLEDVLARAHQLLGDTLASVVLFGSRARGSSHPGSDLDLLIVAQSLPDEAVRRELALDIAEVGFDYGLPIQVVLASTEETKGLLRNNFPFSTLAKSHPEPVEGRLLWLRGLKTCSKSPFDKLRMISR